MTPQEQDTLCICGQIDCAIPFGFCHCECGRKTKISGINDKRFGYIKGKPLKRIHGHGSVVPRPNLDNDPPFIVDGDLCRRIPLGRNLWAIVDAALFLSLVIYNWHAAWSKNSRGYYAMRWAVIDGEYKRVAMHRELLGLPPVGRQIKGDHENQNTLDNRINNLRPASGSESNYNIKRNALNTSGYKGVTFNKEKQKWVARISANSIRYYLGAFDTAEEAYAAYCAAAEVYHGEFKRVA